MANRYHIFSAAFESHEAAEVYCYDPIDANSPEQINLDQPNATIDTNQLELAVQDEIIPFLESILDPASVESVMFSFASAGKMPFNANYLKTPFQSGIKPFIQPLLKAASANRTPKNNAVANTLIAINAKGILGTDGELQSTDQLTYLGQFAAAQS